MGLDNPIHLAILLMVLLLVFGAKRLPEMGRSLGSGLRGFKDAVTDDGPPAPPSGPEQLPPSAPIQSLETPSAREPTGTPLQ
jgi:sec-independent protein translocase protein TatA